MGFLGVTVYDPLSDPRSIALLSLVFRGWGVFGRAKSPSYGPVKLRLPFPTGMALFSFVSKKKKKLERIKQLEWGKGK